MAGYLVDTGTYTFSTAHDFYNDLSGVIGTDQRIGTPTVASYRWPSWPRSSGCIR
jgi:hypothetical protein